MSDILGVISAIFVLVFGPIIIFLGAREEYRRWKKGGRAWCWETGCDCIGECVIPEHQYKEPTNVPKP